MSRKIPIDVSYVHGTKIILIKLHTINIIRFHIESHKYLDYIFLSSND